MRQFQKLKKLSRGDQVAVISPSAGLPQLFPWVQDLGLERMRTIFGLEPVEYPTTRVMGSPLEDRARDIMAAFADPNNKAVFASIGGSDQIKLIKLLDSAVFLANPKPFFGYSDNTHLHSFLWNLGIPSYYGGGVMNQFGMNHAMFDMTVTSLNHALFEEGEYEIEVAREYNDEGLDWAIRENLDKLRTLDPNIGLVWDGNIDAEGILWGGCVESLIAQTAAGVYLPPDEDLDGAILYIETAEDIPEPWIVAYLLTGFGERGWLNRFKAILVGRPKAWEFEKPQSKEAKYLYSETQRNIVVDTVRQYNSEIPIVQNIDFGHTDPQIVMPSGGMAKVNSREQTIVLTY